MNKLKYFLLRISFLTVLLIIFHYIYLHLFYESDLQKYSPIINKVRGVINDKSEIIYLGESSNTTYRNDDKDKRNISEFIFNCFPTKKCGTISKDASHAGVYYELLQNIPDNSNVKTVIVTLNMRSFNANWIYSNLETQLQKELVLLKDRPILLNRFLLSFKGYDIKTEKEREKQFKQKWRNELLVFPEKFVFNTVAEWDRYVWHNGVKNKDGSINRPLTELFCQYVKTYAFQIDTADNPRIVDFDKIVVLAKKRNWKLIFNLMAENVEMADTLVCKELVYLMKQNRDLLVSRYTSMGVIVVDNLESVPDSEYIDRNWTTEHYAETGRKKIAQNVALRLKSIYPDAYLKISPK